MNAKHFAPVLALALIGAAPPAPQLSMPGYQEPAQQWKDIEQARKDDPERCRDTIRKVREENGQAELERAPASEERPLFIAAVDQRVDDCSVLVMRQDTSDIRPVPEVETGTVKLRPAN